METPTFDTSAARAALEGELAAAIAELEPLRVNAETTKRAAEDARWRFQIFLLHFNAATRRGADPASPALLEQLHSERQARDVANGTAEKAKRALSNAAWKADCARAGLDQLHLLQHPPPPEHRPEIARRPKPDLGSFDPIVFPAGAAPADNST